jgi:predicted choloylglycine hydrolase
MSYNVTLVDARGSFATVFLSPDRSPEVRIQAAATNHQRRVEWHQHATATATVERERHLMMLLADKKMTDSALRRAFLQPPVYSRAFDRGFGTLYSAAYWPQQGRAEYYWPGDKWPQSFAQFDSGDRQIGFFKGSVED